MEIVLKNTKSKYLEIFSLLDLDNIHKTFKRFSSIKEPLEAKVFAVNESISSYQLSKLKTHFDKINRLKVLAFASKLCEKNGYDSKIFCGIKERSFKGFESNNALKIWDGPYQIALEDSSALIKTLMRSEESSFIIYPDVIKNEIKKEISLIKNNS